MSDMNTPTSSDSERRLEELLAEFLAAEDAGQPLDIAEFLAQHAEFGDELKSFFREYERIAGLAAPLRTAAEAAFSIECESDAGTQPSTTGRTHNNLESTATPGDTAEAFTLPIVSLEDPDATSPATPNGQGESKQSLGGTKVPYFGDYELIEVLGLGGMGVVYKARQLSLNRLVALKMLQAGILATDNDLRRFQNEAEAVALLDHRHIVPILEIGQYESQRYYSMKLIGGASLDRKLDDYVADPRSAAVLVAKVAEAVHHAHQRGILHRDLKPGNVLIDELGKPHVTDFGLAKRIQGDSEITQPGAILGTPAYMAPEQASGKREAVTTATDIYGLGAILYALLTGQAPFTGDSASETLQHVRDHAPELPTKRRPDVPRDLEVICLKCLEKNPTRRYISAQAVAADLGRFVNREPIVARPVGALTRGWLWCRRKPALASLVAALFAAVVIGVAGIAWNWREAVRQRATSDARLNQTFRIVDGLSTKLVENWLEDRLDPIQKGVLEAALIQYGNLVQQAAKEPALRLEHGRTYQRMGDIHSMLGRAAESEAAYRRALGIIEPLMSETPGDPEVRRALAVTRSHLGDLSARRNRSDEAALLYKQAEDLLDPLAFPPGATTAAPVDRLLLARTLRGKAELLRRQGDIKAARPTASRACELFEQGLAAEPQNTEFQSDLVQANDFLGRILREFGDMSAAEKAFRRAYDLLDRLVVAFPTVPRYREAMFHVCNGLGGIEYDGGRWADCEIHWRRQYKEAERLFQDFPDHFAYQRFLAGGCSNLGGILAEQSRSQEAEPILRRGIELNTALSAQHPGDEEIRFDLANCHFNLGYLQLKLGRADEALASAEQARKYAGALLHTSPKIPVYRHAMAWACRLRAEALDALNRPGVEEAYREWLSISESLATQFPANVLYQIDLARCQSGLGGLMAKGKRDDEAEQMFRNALAVLEPKEPSGWTLERRRLKAIVLSNQGEFRRAAQRPGAEASLRESIKIAQELASRRPVTRDGLQFLAIAQNNLAEILDVQNDLEAAIKLFGESIGALERLAAEVPTAIDTQSYLGYVAEQQGKLLAKTNRPAEAKPAFEKAVTHQKQAVNLSGGRAPAYREMLAGHLRLLADTCLVLGAYDDAMRAVVDLPKYVPQQGQGYFDAAKILARCVSQVENDDNLTPARRDEISRKYLGRTVVMLREALDSDPKLSESIKADPGLKGLFDRPEVKELRVLFFPSVF